jgi:salicylate hydroxylase
MANSEQTSDIADIAIIGAGIGGAAAAVALQQAGFVAEVFEQAPEIREVGGAVVIRDPSMALFETWRVLDHLRPALVAIREIEMRDPGGEVTGSTPVTFQAGEGEIAYSVHRANVHDALVKQIPPDRLHLNHKLIQIDSGPGDAEATFENGRHVRAKLIIGADGLKSQIRHLFDETPLHFDHMVTHRTIAPASVLPETMPNDRLRMWSAGKLIIITLPIRGGREVAIDAVIPTEIPPEHLWSSTSPDDLLSVYKDFDPLIAELIRNRTVDVTTHPVYDKDPIHTWTDGRVVLLGDAAHPMAPLQGQGANQAIQDAGALADVLTGVHRDDQMAALRAYQSARSPVTERLQILSRKPPEVSKRSGGPANAIRV